MIQGASPSAWMHSGEGKKQTKQKHITGVTDSSLAAEKTKETQDLKKGDMRWYNQGFGEVWLYLKIAVRGKTMPKIGKIREIDVKLFL